MNVDESQFAWNCFPQHIIEGKIEGMRIRIRRCKQIPEKIVEFGELALDKAVNLSQETVLFEREEQMLHCTRIRRGYDLR